MKTFTIKGPKKWFYYFWSLGMILSGTTQGWVHLGVIWIKFGFLFFPISSSMMSWITPHFYPTCFAQSSPLLIYKTWTNEKVFNVPTKASILGTFKVYESINFVQQWANQNGLMQKQKCWTWEEPLKKCKVQN
jgi:hypothetical protein